MNLQNLLNQFMGAVNTATRMQAPAPGFSGRLSKLTGNMPGGLVGGAAAGGIMALLMSNKSARKFAGTAATYGGAALLGGLAYKAFKTWQQESNARGNPEDGSDSPVYSLNPSPPDFELQLIKAMIAAAKADGHIDATEQEHIFTTVDRMELSQDMKALVLDLLRQPISVADIARGVTDMTQKSELYLASCLVINPDHPSEQVHLSQLAQALQLPPALTRQIHLQAQQVMTETH